MKKLFLCSLVLLLLFIESAYSQEVPKLVATKTGIGPVILKIDKVKAGDLLRLVREWVKKYFGYPIPTTDDKAIKLYGWWPNAFTLSIDKGIYLFDMQYTFLIIVEDNSLTLSFLPGSIRWHPYSKEADFTYADFFNKNGSVKDSYMEAKEMLELTFNPVPVALYAFVKERLTPVLINTDFEKGYIKDGMRYSVWQYFNSEKQPELVINHSTNKLMYLIPDTSAYVVFKNGEWVSSKLNIHPVPLTGYHNFYTTVSEALDLPEKGCKGGTEGKVTLTFEVDSLGSTTNPALVHGMGGGCDSVVLTGFNRIEAMWIPGMIGKKRLPTKFAMSVRLTQDKNNPSREAEGFKVNPQIARSIEEVVVINPLVSNKLYTFVEKSAEPVGGLTQFYMWVGKTLRYPAQARRMGLEGKVFIKFVIEPSGEITNAQIVKGFNGVCDQEALRVISISPRWKPGTQSGVPVRQVYTLPISFRLAE